MRETMDVHGLSRRGKNMKCTDEGCQNTTGLRCSSCRRVLCRKHLDEHLEIKLVADDNKEDFYQRIDPETDKFHCEGREIAPKVAEYWLEVDPDSKMPKAGACYAYYPGDRPHPDGFFIKVREIEGVNNQTEDTDAACNRRP